jgi:hypothetical protein
MEFFQSRTEMDGFQENSLRKILGKTAFHSAKNRNLISVSQLDEDGYDIRFEEGKVLMEDRSTGLIENIGVKKGRLYEFAGAVSERRADMTLWHKRLAHINEKDLSTMISDEVVKGLNIRSNQNCFCKA